MNSFIVIKESKKRRNIDSVTPSPESLHSFEALYDVGSVLGEGAYSVVKMGRYKSTGERVAIKCIDKSKLNEEDEGALRREVDIMKSLDHENIVQFIDFFEEDMFFYVVLEFMSGGELFDRIIQKTCYNEREARDVVIKVLNGIKYCHDRGIAHRDMKPENLLLSSDSDDCLIKIADFGFAVQSTENSNMASFSMACGSPGYIAPEVLHRKPYDKSVDMWAIGVITYILLGGYPPFYDENNFKLFKQIKRGEFEFHDEYWSNVSAEAKNFISDLIVVDPTKRLNADAALGHAWLQCDSSELEAHNLDMSAASLKRFQLRKKFRAAGNAVIAMNRWGKLLDDNIKPSRTVPIEDNIEDEEFC